MIEIKDKIDCCGCGACENACIAGCITMTADKEGFLFPRVNKDACINCGACDRACPILCQDTGAALNTEVFKKPKAIGGWIKDDAIRYDSSSGGAFSLFANYILSQGGIVYGAAMCDDMQVRHTAVECKEDLTRLRGSKYVQSQIGDTYKKIKENLNDGRAVLFSGTPCQAAGLYSYLGKRKYEKLFVIDFICHGIPSPRVFADYISYMENKIGERITEFKFRMKDRNWNPSGLQLGTGTGTGTGTGHFVRQYPGFMDPYMNGFLDDTYLRLSCYDCKFKSLPKQYADITIADFWGVKKRYPDLYDGKGTSLVLINSKHGQDIFELVKDDFFYKEVDFEKAIQRNKSLIKSVKFNTRREKFFAEYENRPFVFLMHKYMTPFNWGVHKAQSIAWVLIANTAKKILTPFLHLVGQEWSEVQWESFFQFIKFAMVGVSNVLVSYSINICTLLILDKAVPGCEFDYIVANITAFLLSVLWSFFWNSRKVFQVKSSRTDKAKALFKSYLSYAFSGIVLNNLLGTLWIQVIGISKFIAPLLNLPITVPTNFFILKKWAFKEK